MPEPSGIITTTVLGPVTTQTGTSVFGFPTMEAATIALAVLSFITALAAIWYAWLLRQQLRSQYETYVDLTRWDGDSRIELTNLGPGPALSVDVRAAYVSGGLLRRKHYLELSMAGLPVGAKQSIEMKEVTPFDDFYVDSDHLDEAPTWEIVAYTVFRKEMPPRRASMEPPEQLSIFTSPLKRLLRWL